MTKSEILEQTKITCRVRRLSLHTERTYSHWISRFSDHIATCPKETRENRLRLFLEGLAPCSAASTQNQALNAVVFLYRDVLKEPLGDIGKWARAKRPKKLPTWLTAAEMDSLLAD